MRRLLFTISFMLFALAVVANPVSRQTARSVAAKFAMAQKLPVNESSLVEIAPVQMFHQLYVFGINGQKGFVIVAADDRVLPILGYSTMTQFRTDDMPDHLMEWLRDYEDQIDSLVAYNVEPSAEVQKEWTRWQTGTESSNAATPVVSTLLTTTWDQSPYYNNLCPYDGSDQTVTGCVATAMAQIMKYWNHPTTGYGSHSYTWSNQTLSADFANTTYNWANMPNELNSNSTATQVNAVATLMYHVGVSMEMDYGTSAHGGSGAMSNATSSNDPSAESALKNFFKYSNSLHSINYWTTTDAQWKAMLRNELDNARPVLYSGRDASGGHAFVCDGYDSDGYFHINWGWGGYCDAYYAIGSLNPQPGGTGGNSTYTFNIRNTAIVGIQPIVGQVPTQTVVTAAVNNTAYGSVTGAGTYNAYDTIQLTAYASEGYIFDHWDNGNTMNPLFTTATSSSYSRTAYFAPLPTDTLHYCENDMWTAWGGGSGTHNWGIRYPSSALDTGRALKAVEFYPYETGTYTVRIYQGETGNMTQVYNQSYSIDDSEQWVTLAFSTKCNIDATRSLWITLEYTGSGYPMSCTGNFSGSSDGMLIYENSTWVSYNDYGYYYTWLIKGITSTAEAVDTIYATGHNYNEIMSSSYGLTQYALITDAGTFYFTVDGDTGATINRVYTLDDLASYYTFFINNDGNYYKFTTAEFTKLSSDTYSARAMCEDGNYYVVSIAPLPPITNPIDTVTVTISSNLNDIRLIDIVQERGIFQFYGPSDDNLYTAYCAFQGVTSIVGTHPESEVYKSYTSLYDSDGNYIEFNNMIGDANVALNNGIYTFTMNYVGIDSVLYQIGIQYHTPTPLATYNIIANNLAVDSSYTDDYGLFVIQFSDSAYRFLSYIYWDGESIDGTYDQDDIYNGNIAVYDAVTGNLLNKGYFTNITITTVDALTTVTGNVLCYGDINYTFTATGYVAPQVDTIYATGHNYNEIMSSSYGLTQYALITDAGTFYFTVDGDTGATINRVYTLDELASYYTFFINNDGNYYNFTSAEFTKLSSDTYSACAMCEDGNYYVVSIAPLPPITNPIDSIVINTTDRTKGRLTDAITNYGLVQLIGADSDYILYFAYSTSSVTGTFTESDISTDYTGLWRLTDGAQIPLNNLLDNVVVSQNAGITTATIKWVGTDSILYIINYTYFDPVATTQRAFNGNSLTITQNADYDTYADYYGYYVYDFTATSTSGEVVSGTVYNSNDDNAYGTWTIDGGLIELSVTDNNETERDAFSGSVNISAGTLTGSTLMYGDVQYTFNVTADTTYNVTVNFTANNVSTQYFDTVISGETLEGYYVIISSTDGTYSFNFFIENIQDMVDGVTYTLNDLNEDYSYGVDYDLYDYAIYTSVSLTRTNGVYTGTISATGYYDSSKARTYTLNQLTSVTNPIDTIVINTTDRTKGRLTDAITNYGLVQLIGADSDYILYFAYSTSSVTGTFTESDISTDYTGLWRLTDGAQIPLNNLLDNVVVSQNAGITTATIKWVGTDSILYIINYTYSDPVVVTQKQFVANDLTITSNQYYETYIDYGYYVYDFSATSPTEGILQGTVYNDIADNAYGTWDYADGWLDLEIHDSITGEVIYKTFSGSIAIAQNGSLNTLTGSTLMYGDVQYTFNVTNTDIQPVVLLDSASICQGDIYTWRGRQLTSPGFYVDTIHGATTDTISQLILSVNPTYHLVEAASVLDIDLPYLWHGRALTASGVYYDSLLTVAGCDSVFELTLTVNQYVCQAPTNLTATIIGNKSFRFDWENPTIGTADEQANNFTYLFSTAAVNPDNVKATKTQRTTTTASIAGTLYNHEYHFYIKNVSRGVSSAWTEVTISSIAQYPAVDSLHVVSTETKAVSLAWTRHQYGKERKWKVDVTRTYDNSFVTSLVASTNSIRVTGLEAETEYTFTVSPRITSLTIGDPMSIDATTLAAPAAPVNLRGVISANRELTFTWENGSAVDANNFSYKLSSKYIDINKDKYSDNPDVSGFTDTTVTFTKLSYNTTYYLYVRNVRADGAASEWVLCYVKTNAQNAAVKNLHAEDITTTSFVAVWEKSSAASAENKWKVVLYAADGDSITEAVASTTRYTFIGLTRGTEYRVDVYPRYNSHSFGNVASKNVKTQQTCEAPTNLTYTNPAYRAYTFTWSNPTIGTDEEEPNNFTYILRASSEAFDPDDMTPTGSGLTETTLSKTKLTKGATYYFYVRNEYDGAASAWVGPIVINVPAKAPSTTQDYDDDNDDESNESVETISEVEFTPAEAYVNFDRLYVENIVAGSYVTIVDAAGKTICNEKVNDTYFEYGLYVRGIYTVVIRNAEHNQAIKVVY